MNRYRDWETIREIGKGGQGAVLLARKVTKSASYQFPNGDKISGTAGMVALMFSEMSGLFGGVLPDNPDRLAETAAQRFVDLVSDIASPSLGAIKVPGPPRSDASPLRFQRECEALERYQHPNLLELLDKADDFSWFVTEFHPAGSIDAAWRSGGPVKGSVEGSWKLLRPLVEAVALLHEAGFVHRDIKAKNVFLATDRRLVLGDPGIAFQKGLERLTGPHETVASWEWCPPWAMHGAPEDMDPTHDVFCLVKLLWALIADRLDDGARGEFMHSGDWDEERYDLRKIFRSDVRMQLVSDQLFARVLVRKKPECKVRDARQLLKAGDDMIWALQEETCAHCGFYGLEPHYAGTGNADGQLVHLFMKTPEGKEYATAPLIRCNGCNALKVKRQEGKHY